MRYNDSEKAAVRVSDSFSEALLRLERGASCAALLCDPFTLRAIRAQVVALRRCRLRGSRQLKSGGMTPSASL